MRLCNLILVVAVVLAPTAHVLELPNKLALDGPLWLAVQQHLYRGWGPFVGAPTEIGALLTTLALLVMRRHGRGRTATAIAVMAYVGMLAVFFVFNAPVNAALNGWTAATLPGNWMGYRLQWEIGHALAAALAWAALTAVLRAVRIEAGAAWRS